MIECLEGLRYHEKRCGLFPSLIPLVGCLLERLLLLPSQSSYFGLELFIFILLLLLWLLLLFFNIVMFLGVLGAVLATFFGCCFCMPFL